MEDPARLAIDREAVALWDRVAERNRRSLDAMFV